MITPHFHVTRGVLVLMFTALVLAGCIAVVVRAWVEHLWHGQRRPKMPLRFRVRLGLWPGPGWARRWATWRQHGRPAARKVAWHARPVLTWRQRWFGPARAFAVYLGKAPGRISVYANLEYLTLWIAGPQEGKSQALAGAILDAPRACVATSIRGDLVRSTAGLRSTRGRVHILNPEGAGGIGSTFRFNLVAGCEDIKTAVRRAAAMVEGTGSGPTKGDDLIWQREGSKVMAALLHAAAIGGLQINTVYQWISDKDLSAAFSILDRSGAVETARQSLAAYQFLPDRTQAGITLTMTDSLRWMSLPSCVEAATTPGGEAGWSFEDFVASSDTLYLVSSGDTGAPAAPLMVVLCTEIMQAARTWGAVERPARPPRGAVLKSERLGRLLDRLDPPRMTARVDALRMVLDELPNIAPVPAAEWASWAAGSGVMLCMASQSYAQLVQRYTEKGAAALWQNCKTKVVWGGTSEHELGQIVEKACGTARVRESEWGDRQIEDGNSGGLTAGRRRRLHRHEDMTVMPASELQQLPKDRAVVLQSHARPVIVRPEKVRHRTDVRDAARSGFTAQIPEPVQHPIPKLPPVELLLADKNAVREATGIDSGDLLAWPGELPVPKAPKDAGWLVRDDEES